MSRPNQDVFADTVLACARENRNIVVLTSDSRGSGKLRPFGDALPDQLIEMGIAEQNLVGIAAGLASAGKIVFAVSPACFLTARALEQIKNDVAYSDHPVKLVGISAGVSYGPLGSTHHSLHDFAALTAIHNISIVAPADNYETAAGVRAAIEWPHPLYLRFGKKPMPDLHEPGAPFEIGRAATLSRGSDVTFIATGEMVAEAAGAARLLAAEGLSCGVISMHTVKPLDHGAVLQAASHSTAIITVEEHSVHGGLGSQCAALMMENGCRARFRIMGIPDEHIVTGNQGEIFRHYGMDAPGLAAVAWRLMEDGDRMR
jgi:transketolase